MAVAVTIPRLGWNMDEGVFVGWLKEDGAEVRPGDSLFTLEGEKATQDIECLDAGLLRLPPDAPKPGDRLPVGAVIAYVVRPGEPAPFEGQAAAREPARAAAPSPASPSVRRLARKKGVKIDEIQGTGPGGRVTAEDVQNGGPRRPAAVTADQRVVEGPGTRKKSRRASSPRARRVAAELGIDWTRLQGSGRTGRIRERDVRAAVGAASRAAATDQAGEVISVTPVRRTIAERMVQSLRATAPVTLTTTVDASNLVNLRNQFKAAADAGEIPGYTDFVIKLTATALRSHPPLNARWEGDRIVLLKKIHIGLAVDTEAGLCVPVVRDVPDLSLRQVAIRTRDLSERARRRQLRAEDMQGGTFTVTNLGAFGIDAFTPIINFPECAILGLGRIRRQPVAADERIISREQLTLSLTFDHRVVDGAPAARFLQALGKLIENPGPWLMP